MTYDLDAFLSYPGDESYIRFSSLADVFGVRLALWEVFGVLPGDRGYSIFLTFNPSVKAF